MSNLTSNTSKKLIFVRLLELDDAKNVYSLIDESRQQLKNLVWS